VVSLLSRGGKERRAHILSKKGLIERVELSIGIANLSALVRLCENSILREVKTILY
jgi:hypothetical protein